MRRLAQGADGGRVADIKGITTLTAKAERRKEWEQQLAAHKWSCIGWPEEWGGRNATLAQQVIFAEEYARAGVPGRVNHIGIELAGPTILAFGTDEQKQRFLPGIAAGRRSSARAFPNPMPDRTWPACAPRRGWRANGWSMARRSGPALPTSPTGFSSSPGPRKARRARRA
jgi:alkylation response protein AidB-like acyl-CoA dehydrogenase